VPLNINAPEVADRLRRFFGTVGRIPTALDETIVPVALVGNLDEPPYRQRATNGVGAISQTGAAALTTYGAIRHPLAVGGFTRVRHIIARNTEAAALTVAVNMVSADYVTGELQTEFLAAVEHNTKPSSAVEQPKRLPIVIAGGRAFPLPGYEVASVTLLPNTSFVIPCDFVLTPGWQLLVWSATLNTALTAHVHATYYPA
jgi:hypothetical protein